jgi:hypothetical protein
MLSNTSMNDGSSVIAGHRSQTLADTRRVMGNAPAGAGHEDAVLKNWGSRLSGLLGGLKETKVSLLEKQG